MSSLEDRLQAAGVQAPLAASLARYGALVLEANRKFNLSGATTAEELVPHLLDSLTVAPYVREPYVDIGSGAGLPAIPVALANAVAITMVEATRKKARFLEKALAELGLRGEVIAERAESAAHVERLRERFASGTARAVATAPTVAELLLPFIAIDGVAVLQRGESDRREQVALEDASLMLGGRVETEERLVGGHRIVLVRKTGTTPARFPRRIGVPEKRPLCLS